MITETPMTALERRSVASLALVYMMRMLGLFMVLPLLALYMADMPGATPTLIGLSLGIYGLTQALLQIPFGWLSDQIGRKPVIVGGLLLFALGSVVAATADSVWGIVVGRMLQGCGAIASTLMALVADLTREEQRTKAMAMVGMSIGLSFAIALILGPAVAALGGLFAVFWLTAVLALLGIVLLARVPNPPAAPLRHAEVGMRSGLVRKSLCDANLLRLNFGVFTLHFVLMASFLLVPEALELRLDLPREHHWVVYLATLTVSILGMLALMTLAERRGQPKLAFLLGIGLVGFSVAILGAVPTFYLYVAGLCLFFVGFNFLEATLPSQVSKTVFEGGKGTAMGVYSSCQFMGAFAGGALGGWILEGRGASALIIVSLVLIACWFAIAAAARR